MEFKKTKNETEVETFKTLFAGKSYHVESTTTGEIIKIITDDQTIKAWALTNGFI